jgi:hypothetical protein
VLEHAVTIYVRKGASAYAETLTVQQIVGKGSLTIQGELYWNGQCAAAATPSATKFNLTSATGSSIEAGDIILVTDGFGSTGTYKYYTYSTVKATTDKGSNVWEIEVNDALDSGNIGSGDYYTIIKTKLSGSFTATATSGLTLNGLGLNNVGTTTICLSIVGNSTITINCCSIIGGTSGGVAIYLLSGSTITNMVSSYIKASYAISGEDTGVFYINSENSDSYACVVEAATSGYGVYASKETTGRGFRCIVYAPSGTGFYVARGSDVTLSRITIPTGTTSGIVAIYAGIVVATTMNNQATTPLTPAAATDPSYIYNA